MDTETQLALLQERFENLKIQQGRLVSHFESEQRVSVSQGKRIDDALRRVEHLEKEQDRQRGENKHTAYIWISIISVIISLVSAIFQLIKP